MKNLKRYTVTIKENGDSFSAFEMKKINKWIADYLESAMYQDEPWIPHFDITEETI